MVETTKESLSIEGWLLVAEDQIGSVLEVLANNFPASLQMYNFIKCSLLWTSHYPDVRIKIFRKLSNGMDSIIATMKGNENIVTAYSLNGADLDVGNALSGNDIINWNEGPAHLTCISMELCPSIVEAVTQSGKMIYHRTFNSFWLPADIAKTVDVQCPDDMYLSKLESCHAATVTQHWPYARATSLEQITQMINVLDSVGIFRKKDSTLVSWVLNTFYGIGMFYTIEEYRRKGYGAIVFRHLVKSLGNQGISCYLSVLPDNHSALALFKKLEFQQAEQVQFMRAV